MTRKSSGSLYKGYLSALSEASSNARVPVVVLVYETIGNALAKSTEVMVTLSVVVAKVRGWVGFRCTELELSVNWTM